MLDELRQKVQEAVEGGFQEDTLKKMREQAKTIFISAEEDFEYWIKQDLGYNIAYFVQQMAEDAVNAMLHGDDEQMRKHLRCDGYTGREGRHEVIHGKLFETGAIELRKKIVEAHAPLIKDERILDLEAQVASFVKQLIAADKEKELLRSQLYETKERNQP
jgi:hypothetical protein